MPFGFGKALDVLRDGDPVRRTSWNPTTFIMMVAAGPPSVPTDTALLRAAPEFATVPAGYSAHIDIVNYDGVDLEVRPWTVTQDAIMAEDWDYVR